jgi:hypothetical protein
VVHLDHSAFYSTVDVSRKKMMLQQVMMVYCYYYYYCFDDDDRSLMTSKKRKRRCHIFDMSTIGTIRMSVSNVKGHSCSSEFGPFLYALLFFLSFFAVFFIFFFLFNIASSSSSAFRCNNSIHKE